MTLATLAAVKSKLGITLTDTSLDGALQPVLAAASDLLSRETGYDPTATERTDYLTDVEESGWIRTRFRPVDTVHGVTVTARDAGSSTSTTLTADLVDATEGRIKLVPEGWLYAPWRTANKAGEWAIVAVHYKTVAHSLTTLAADVADACAELAAYWFTEHRANLASGSAGPISESYINAPLPPSVLAVIWRHKRRAARWV